MVLFPEASRCQLGSVEANRQEGLRRISLPDLGARGAELKGGGDPGRHKPDHKTHPINHVMNLIIPAMMTSYCHVSPNPRPAPKQAPTFISKVVPPGINEGSGPIYTCDQPSSREPAQQNNGERLRAKGHAVGPNVADVTDHTCRRSLALALFIKTRDYCKAPAQYRCSRKAHKPHMVQKPWRGSTLRAFETSRLRRMGCTCQVGSSQLDLSLRLGSF